MSENTVRKYVKALEDKHLITTQPTTIRTKDGRAQNGSLLYTIRPIQEALEDYYRRQNEQLELDTARQRAEQAIIAYDRKHGTQTEYTV